MSKCSPRIRSDVGARLIGSVSCLAGVMLGEPALADPVPHWQQAGSFGSSFFDSMAYDSNRHVTVVFKSDAPYQQTRGEIWEWDGTIWTIRSSSNRGPSLRSLSTMAYDSERQ